MEKEEKIIWQGRSANITYLLGHLIPWIFFGFIAIASGSWFVLIYPALISFLLWIKIRTTIYTFTNRRLQIKKGILVKQKTDISWTNVSDIETRTALGISDIIIRGTGRKKYKVKGMLNGEYITEEINKYRRNITS